MSNQNLKLVTVPYKPHSLQHRIHMSNARFRVCVCGVRWGKTKLAVHEVFRCLGKPKAKAWWIAPQYSIGMVAWRMFLEDIPSDLIERVDRRQLEIEMVNKSLIWFKTAEKPEVLRAEGLDLAVFDEAPYIKQSTWSESVRPRLSDPDKFGRALFIGTPRGLNWYYQLFLIGKNKIDLDYESFQYPSWTNPYLDPKEIEAAKRQMPTRLFEQEYGAQFLPDLGAIFRLNKDNNGNYINIKGMLQAPQPEERYFAGVDFGKKIDFTVVFVLNSQGQVVAYDRFKTVGYPLQIQRVLNLVRSYNEAPLLIDSTGPGEPLYDFMRPDYWNVQSYPITFGSKIKLIDNLAIALERGEITFPDISVLIDEIRLFGEETKESSARRYKAPKGFKDDCVIALALATWLLRKQPIEPSFTFLDW